MGKQPIPIPNPPNVSCGIGVGFKQQMVKSLGVVYNEIRKPPQSTVKKIGQIRELVAAEKFKVEVPLNLSVSAMVKLWF